MPENHLAQETSPYLLQHKDNPVQWYPWGEAAFEAARRDARPILLSIGYAACHWCHVMAHESFESGEIASLMNELFVNIKVDREERPDLDQIYQAALSLLGEHGGWPLTMFLTPAGEPFWGGTYFPPEPRFGRPGFPQVLHSIAAIYGKEPDKVTKNVAALQEALEKLSENQPGGRIPTERLDQVAERLVREIDPFHGGIGSAPKFPQVSILKLLWRAWRRTKAEPFRRAVDLTLTRMSQGGIYDHLGGGFARYAVDDRWLVPHFEKMLYDNAQLIDILTWAWQDSGNPLYAQRVRETVDWVLREMLAASRLSPADAPDTPLGGFASTLDADSEGEEGRFYVWTEAEIDQALGEESAVFKAAYDIGPEGNWEGKTILNRSAAPELCEPETEVRLAVARKILSQRRAKRIWPGWDDKVLADWNGLMITALANAAQAFKEPLWLAAAERAFVFVTDHMIRDGRLYHAWRHGQLKHPATLEDYANLCEAALALNEATGKPAYLAQAEDWIAILEKHHADSRSGGYFMTADDTEQLIVRSQTAYDSAVPSGNGTLAGVLARLYYVTGKDDYRVKAETLIATFSGELDRNFFPLATLLNGSEVFDHAVQVVIVGDRADARALADIVYGISLPNRVLQLVESSATLPAGHPAHGKAQLDGQSTAYVCRGPSCSLPITAASELSDALRA